MKRHKNMKLVGTPRHHKTTQSDNKWNKDALMQLTPVSDETDSV